MILRAVICLSLMLGYGLQAQNLIPNPSFEDTLCIDNPTDELYIALADWFNANGATPDRYTAAQTDIPCYFNSIYDPDLLNAGEWQYPAHGQHMVGLWCGNDLNISRDLIEARLTESLQADSVYCFSMYVSLGNSQSLAIDRIGAFFSTDSVYDTDWAGGYDLPWYVTSPAGVFLTDTVEWMHISGEYTAHGGEEYIIIGNNFDDTETAYVTVDGTIDWAVAYYFVDDLSLVKCNTTGLDEWGSPSLELGGANGALILTGPPGLYWEVYELTGRLLAKGKLPAVSSLDIGDSLGMYLIRWSYAGKQGSMKYIGR